MSCSLFRALPTRDCSMSAWARSRLPTYKLSIHERAPNPLKKVDMPFEKCPSSPHLKHARAGPPPPDFVLARVPPVDGQSTREFTLINGGCVGTDLRCSDRSRCIYSKHQKDHGNSQTSSQRTAPSSSPSLRHWDKLQPEDR